MRYVIVGGGIAGTMAAEELRRRDAAAEVALVDQEEHPCYSRVLLPHYVKGLIPREKVFLRKPTWYQEQRIEWLPGTRITDIDTRNAFVRTFDSREYPYDKLLLAPGGDVNLADEDPRGTSYLRTLDDADHLLALLREVRTLPVEERRAVVVGGGFIALEYINIFAHYGLPTTVIMRGSGFWSRILSSAAQDMLLAHATERGVHVITGETSTLVGERVLTSVRTGSGREVLTPIVGVGIGQQVDRRMIIDAGVACGIGIQANGFLETSVPGVYTAGDAAEFDHALFGRQLLMGNWLNAQMQGRAVAATMSGERTAFTLLTSYATQLLGMHVVFIGDTSRAHADEVTTEVTAGKGVVDLYRRSGQIVGATLVGDVHMRAAVTKAIQEKRQTV